MSVFDFFRRPSLKSSTTRRVVRDEPGPLTAHQAWEWVWPAIQALDPEARLTLLTSGLDIGPDGRSFTWEFGFEMPQRRGYALFSIEPSGRDPDTDPIILVERMHSMDRAQMNQHPVLPALFRDSPEAVAELAAQGVDFVAGPSDMVLFARVQVSGRAVWVTDYWGEERAVPFVAMTR